MSVQLVYLAHSSVIGKHSFNDNGSGMCIKHSVFAKLIENNLLIRLGESIYIESHHLLIYI